MAKKRRNKLNGVLLGPHALLLPKEEPDDYAAFFLEVHNAIAPSDMIEEIWVRDIVDLSWGVLQFRRLRADRLAELYQRRTPGSHPEFFPLMRSVELVEGLTAAAEQRRNDALCEIERRREVFAHRLRQSVKQIEKGTAPSDPPGNYSNDNLQMARPPAMESADRARDELTTAEPALPPYIQAADDAPGAESNIADTEASEGIPEERASDSGQPSEEDAA